MVNVGEGIVLQFFILRLPQPRSQSLSSQGGKPGAAHAQDQCAQGTEHHLHSLDINVSPVAVCHSHVHQVGHEKRHQKLEHGFCGDADDRQECELFVFSHVGKDP